MRSDLAEQRYLQRHIEPDLPARPPARRWHNVLVIPAYRESADLLERLALLPAGSGRALVILVLNRPDSDPDPQANAALRRAAAGLSQLNSNSDLYVHDVDQLAGPIPAKQGVGLARKIGFDLAFKWHHQGAIHSPWICSTDADARLPTDYFQRLNDVAPGAVAAVYPFRHAPGPDPACNRATALYELRLHQYVLGLEYAASPYAWHSLGSCLAVKAGHYARVRGFPRRAGGEDFYLLNKVAKLGPVARLAGECIALQSRHSHRAPFGTGPAVAAISSAANPAALPLFYHPACFQALRGFLAVVPRLQQAAAKDQDKLLAELLAAGGLAQPLARACSDTLAAMGLAAALLHCRRQGKSPAQFTRQFHQWFDGFRTLKFIHGMRAAGWPEHAFSALESAVPRLWPGAGQWEVAQLREAAMCHWGWTSSASG